MRLEGDGEFVFEGAVRLEWVGVGGEEGRKRGGQVRRHTPSLATYHSCFLTRLFYLVVENVVNVERRAGRQVEPLVGQLDLQVP